MIRTRNADIVYCILPLLFTVGLFFLNDNGVVSYLWTLFLFLVINFFTDRHWRFRNFIVFHLFLFAALVVYAVNLSQMPMQQGLTGGGDFMTDDTAYYNAAADSSFWGMVSGYATAETPFVLLMRFLYPFRIVDPINLIILNILLGLAFLPYLTAKIAEHLFYDQRVCRSAFWLIAFCPFCWSCGLIIMRDVPSLIFILWAFLLFVKGKYLWMTIPVALLLWIKFGFIVFLFVPVVCYMYSRTGRRLTRKKMWFFIGALFALLVLYVVVLPHLSSITDGKLEDGNLFRNEFMDFIARSNEQSLLIQIYQMPVGIRIPLLILAFIAVPMFEIKNGLMSPHGFLVLAYTVYIMFLCGYAFRLLFSRQKLVANARMLLWIILFQALALGMVSLQLRHKVILMPFIYMAVAYGMNRLPNSLPARMAQVGYVFANIVYAVYKSGIN